MKNRILITGGLGYVGTQLCKTLCTDPNNSITVIDNNFNPERVVWLIKHGIMFYQRNIFDIRDLIKYVDVCYHLAGITDVPQTVAQSTPEKDAEIHRIGTEGTRYLIDNIDKNTHIIFASTQVVYDGLPDEKLNITEDLDPCPSVAYSKSKRQSEIDLLNSDKNFTIARFASVYGYNESMRWKILPNLFSKMSAQNLDLKVFGAENYKPLIGINDLAECLKFLSQSTFYGEIFHCVNENKKVIDIANICKSVNPKISVHIVEEETPNKGFTLSNKKLLSTGFKFRQTIQEEIRTMIGLWKNK